MISLKFDRSIIHWPGDDEPMDYGWHVTLYWRGQHRVRWHSYKNTTRMWPHISRGADENCNRSVTVLLWPIGHLDVWWEPHFRWDEDGPCDHCRAVDDYIAEHGDLPNWA